jgi:hypothetical protein
VGLLSYDVETASTPPIPCAPSLIGRDTVGAWIAPSGACYGVARKGQHERVATRIRAAGIGPERTWNTASRWMQVKENGDLYCGVYHTSAQWEALYDMLDAAPDGCWKERLRDSVARARDEASRVVQLPRETLEILPNGAAGQPCPAASRRRPYEHPGD